MAGKAKKSSKFAKKGASSLAVVRRKSASIEAYKGSIQDIVRGLRDRDNLINSAEIMDAMLEKGYTSEKEIARAFAEEYGIEFIENLEDYKISEETLKIVSRKTCEKYTVIPIIKMEKTLVVAFADPSDIHIRDTLSLITDLKIQPVVATKSSIKKTFNRYFDRQKEVDSLFYDLDMVASVSDQEENVLDLNKTGKQKSDPIVVFVNLVFSDAIQLGASDIHIEPYEKNHSHSLSCGRPSSRKTCFAERDRRGAYLPHKGHKQYGHQ